MNGITHDGRGMRDEDRLHSGRGDGGVGHALDWNSVQCWRKHKSNNYCDDGYACVGLACLNLVAALMGFQRYFTERRLCTMSRHSATRLKSWALVQVSDNFGLCNAFTAGEKRAGGGRVKMPVTKRLARSLAADMTRWRCGDSGSHVPLKSATAELGHLVGRK